jgi:hypothetical protein
MCIAGGETMLLQPQLLGSFWQSFSPGKGLELRDLVTLVEPRFNQLTGEQMCVFSVELGYWGVSGVL